MFAGDPNYKDLQWRPCEKHEDCQHVILPEGMRLCDNCDDSGGWCYMFDGDSPEHEESFVCPECHGAGVVKERTQ